MFEPLRQGRSRNNKACYIRYKYYSRVPTICSECRGCSGPLGRNSVCLIHESLFKGSLLRAKVGKKICVALCSQLRAACSGVLPPSPHFVFRDRVPMVNILPAPHAIQRHQDGLTGPIHFCAAIKRRSKPVQWYTLLQLVIIGLCTYSCRRPWRGSPTCGFGSRRSCHCGTPT